MKGAKSCTVLVVSLEMRRNSAHQKSGFAD